MTNADHLKSVYDRIGGFAAIGRIVLDLYDRALESDVVGPYFDGIDLARLVDHQTRFMAHVTGGPAEFSLARLGQAHRRLAITGAAFDTMSGLIDDTLADHGVSADDRAVILGVVAAHRPMIVAAEEA